MRRGIFSLAMLLSLFVLSFMAAWIYLERHPKGSGETASGVWWPRGDALSFSVSLPDQNVSWPFSKLSGSWMLLMRVPPNCGKDCEFRAFSMRQLRTALGKYQSSCVRVMLWPEHAEGQAMARLQERYPGMLHLKQKAKADFNRLPEESWLLVDPSGMPVIYYPPSVSWKHVLRDVKKLLAMYGRQE